MICEKCSNICCSICGKQLGRFPSGKTVKDEENWANGKLEFKRKGKDHYEEFLFCPDHNPQEVSAWIAKSFIEVSR